MSAPPDDPSSAEPLAPADPAPERASTPAGAPRPWRDPLWRARWAVPALALAVALVVLVRAHLHFFFPWAGPVSNDEGYISAMALRMIHGRWLPYVDAVSQRGPLLYWITAIAMKIGGQFSWFPIRWLALGAGTITVLLSFAVAAEFATPLAAGVAALFLTYFLSYELNPWDGVGFNGEILGMVWVLASLLCLGRAQRPLERPAAHPSDEGPFRVSAGAPPPPDGFVETAPLRGRWLVAAGVFAAMAGLSKQMTLIHAAPSLAWVLLGRVGEARPFGRRLRDAGLYLAGMAAPYAVVFAIYAATGHLREFTYYYQRYGRDIFMAPLTREYMRDKIREQVDRYFMGIAAVSSLGVVALSRSVRALVSEEARGLERWRRHARGVFLVAQLVCGAFGACFTWRFFPHYFVQVYPVAALVAGAVAASLAYEPAHPRDRGALAGALTLVLGAAVLLAVASSALGRNVRTRRETDRWYQDPRADPIVRYVLERSRPDEKIFVWGFRAETYVSSGRLPASRFVYTVYPSGVVPWFQSTRDEEERRVVPGSRQQLRDDLEAARPVLVVDAGRSMNGRYMYNYPDLRAYLDRNYCFMRYVDGEPVYRRRVNGDCPPADY